MSHELRDPLRGLLQDPVEHDDLERVRRRVHASLRMPRERAWRWAPFAAALLVLGASLGAWWLSSPAPDRGPLRFATGEALVTIAPAAQLRTIALHEGSAITVGPGTTLDALESTSDRVVLVQSDGRATYDVRPGGPRRWSIDAGALVVDVVGTRFTVTRHGTDVRVEVERGRVRVRGARVEGGVRTLSAGQSLAVRDPDPPRAPPATASAPSVAPIPVVARVASPRWRLLASHGDYEGAFEALGPSELERLSRTARSVDELFALADTARLSGHPALAVEPLRRLIDSYPGDARAATAALTLGRLQLDALDSPEQACTALDRALALGVPPNLEEIAYARAIEAHRRAGHEVRVRELTDAYLERFPAGRYAGELRSTDDE